MNEPSYDDSNPHPHPLSNSQSNPQSDPQSDPQQPKTSLTTTLDSVRALLKNKNFSIYFFAAISIGLVIIITVLLMKPHRIASKIIDLPTITTHSTPDNSGKHCADESIIINYGTLECQTAETIAAQLRVLSNQDSNQVSGFTCTIEHSRDPERYFYDYWCTNPENGFFGSFRKNYYSQFPNGFSHWVKDPIVYARQQKPGIDFRTRDNTVQCIITQRNTPLLQCTGDFPIKPGQTIPNNLVNLLPSAPATIGFGQTVEFSYGKNMILEPGSALYYLHYACQATSAAITCYSLMNNGGGFTVSHDYWIPQH